MMRKTHRAFAGAFWLGSTLAVDALALRSGHSAPFSPVVVATGLLTAPMFSSGKSSPDVDHVWAPGPPQKNYDWKGHRGFTHRVWFASFLTLLTGVLPYCFLLSTGLPPGIASGIFAPVIGWWSHLAGDMIFGRILIAGTKCGLGWETNGLAEKGGKLWRDPAAKVSVYLSAGLIAAHLALLVTTYG